MNADEIKNKYTNYLSMDQENIFTIPTAEEDALCNLIILLSKREKRSPAEFLESIFCVDICLTEGDSCDYVKQK